MRLVLVISSLQAGGAERVLSTMANFWEEKGWAVSIVTFDDVSSQPFYTLKPRIRHIPLALFGNASSILGGVCNNWRRVRKLRRTICENAPDAIISFIDKTNVLVLLATWGMSIHVVVSERTDPRQYSFGRIWNSLRLLTYLKATHVVVQTHRAKEYFPKILQSKVVVIPNPVTPIPKAQQISQASFQKPFIAFMGRLVEEKGFDLLLRAFARLANKFPQWSLNVFGEGPLRVSSEMLCDELGLSERVQFHGLIRNPYDVLIQADLFVLPSRTEGFPNAMLDAMACGLPVIATDCPSGPGEIVHHGNDGLLVPTENEEQLGRAMQRLMENEAERGRLGNNARNVSQRYSLERIMSLWEEVL